MAVSSMYQLNNLSNANGNTLDLIFTNELENSWVCLVDEHDLLSPNTSIHHSALCVVFMMTEYQYPSTNLFRSEYDYKNGNYHELERLLNEIN
jgi:hypothetical protein